MQRFIFASLMVAVLTVQGAVLAAGHPVTEKFEALHRAMLADPSNKRFADFVKQEHISAEDWARGLQAANAPGAKRAYLGVYFENYLLELLEDMDPRERERYLDRALKAADDDAVLARLIPALLEANVDARNKYFPVDGGDLEPTAKRRWAARAEKALAQDQGDTIRRQRFRRLYGALETQPERLAAFVRQNPQSETLDGLSVNASQMAEPAVVTAVLESDDEDGADLTKSRLMERLHHILRVPAAEKASIRKKLGRIAGRSRDQKVKERLEKMKQRLEAGR